MMTRQTSTDRSALDSAATSYGTGTIMIMTIITTTRMRGAIG
jgi:hypothetical protein